MLLKKFHEIFEMTVQVSYRLSKKDLAGYSARVTSPAEKKTVMRPTHEMEGTVHIIDKNIEPEKRKYPRDIYSVPFNYETDGIQYIGFMKNVSWGGAFFDTPESLNVGQKILMNIILPERGFSYLKGDVLRSNPDGYAIEFQLEG